MTKTAKNFKWGENNFQIWTQQPPKYPCYQISACGLDMHAPNKLKLFQVYIKHYLIPSYPLIWYWGFPGLFLITATSNLLILRTEHQRPEISGDSPGTATCSNNPQIPPPLPFKIPYWVSLQHYPTLSFLSQRPTVPITNAHQAPRLLKLFVPLSSWAI